MDKRKFLLVALVVAGATIRFGTAHAQFATVFVPELATMDNALCRPRGGSPYPLVRLAQAGSEKPQKKSEISPAAPSAAQSVSTGGSADEPVLMSGLGNATIKVTTSSKLAQQFFDQGYRLAWGFNHDEARRAFRKAQQLDPQCAMCFWGEAWVARAEHQLADGSQGKRACGRRNGEREAPRGARNATRAGADPRAREALLEPMRRPTARRSTRRTRMRCGRSRAASRSDAEIATLYADALMNVAPWDYWEPGGKQLRPAVADLVPTLERVLKQNPNHAGAIHLYIHAVEASDNPQTRRTATQTGSASSPPAPGHLVHMPSHIYFVLGRYKDSLAANVRAVQVDEAYIAGAQALGRVPARLLPAQRAFRDGVGADGRRRKDRARFGREARAGSSPLTLRPRRSCSSRSRPRPTSPTRSSPMPARS